jgi:predicted DCC family thiol-disulfide oxidoreductase YuxK
MTAEANPQAVVLFDGQCPLCQRAVRLLKRLDWLKRLQFRDCRDTANLPTCDEPLDPKRLLEEMHLVTPDRTRAYAGYRAFRWIAWRLPLTWGLAPLLYVPGVPWLGHKLYLRVARNRYNLVPCKDGVCRVGSQRSEVRDQKSGRIS